MVKEQKYDVDATSRFQNVKMRSVKLDNEEPYQRVKKGRHDLREEREKRMEDEEVFIRCRMLVTTETCGWNW